MLYHSQHGQPWLTIRKYGWPWSNVENMVVNGQPYLNLDKIVNHGHVLNIGLVENHGQVKNHGKIVNPSQS